MQSPNYIDDPDHYKRLISKINAEVNFPMYLRQNGYKLIKKSAGSMEFKNDRDRIVLQMAREPVTYFNRNDSQDKGLFFMFLMKRNTNFYKAVDAGLQIVNGIGYIENTAMEVQSSKAVRKSLAENFTIVPLRNSNYLRHQRCISKTTINDPLFKGRLLNAYSKRDKGHKNANIAFPKYDLEDHPQNYILYNKTYKSSRDNKIKKFRLVLNQKDHFLFYSNPIKNPYKIVVGESGIDLLSYHELNGSPDNFYVSFSGNVYQKKLDFFGQLTEPYLKTNSVSMISIMDNDIKGFEFDLKLFTNLINRFNPKVYVESSNRHGNVSLTINYTSKVGDQLTNHITLLEVKFKTLKAWDKLISNSIKWVKYKDKIILAFSLPEIIKLNQVNGGKNLFKSLIETITDFYLTFPATIHKSKGKDWNDDLKNYKNAKYVKFETISTDFMGIGDQIELKTTKGPEGAPNLGIIKSINSNSVECDFGLKFSYTIPFSEIRVHLKKNAPLTPEKRKNGTKKNNNLQNLIE
ncbi:toprim domain-containing protein [Arenibacter sp. BSSL-BM3]|uniref:Toprim domain-containing protein n=1 Tax=Arenibacter arenosicollis TaxID=2762274 RepID=A0ABR7QQS5_9FLAO|nr:toprim domain-containing protein [Arenibacter arenosicollis]MBC8769414.1 toprim domain-containing protein [Arenibacter arenosicollis]